MASALLLTTYPDVCGVQRDGARCKVASQECLSIPWNELSTVDVGGKIS